MTRQRLVLITLVLFAVALALRLPGLGSFLTPDEKLWAGRTAQFVTALSTGDWAATSVTGHPGVITMWAGSAGLLAKWLLARPDGAITFLASVGELAANPVRLDYLPWLRLPVAVLCAAAIVASYLLARRVLDERTALLGAGLLLFDPFLLAHGRLLQMDGLVAAFITVSWLALIVALRTGQRRYFVLSGLSIGSAVLTKSPALVMGPLMLLAIVAARLLWPTPQGAEGHRSARAGRVAGLLRDLLWTGVPFVLIIFLLWPALWTVPAETLGSVWGLMTAYGGGEHELGSFWLGRPVAEPGALFYAATLALRTTPVTSIGLLLALSALVLPGRRQRRGTAGMLFAFVLWYGFMITVGAKKFDRYLLPIFGAVDLLAAWGWTSAARWAAGRLQGRCGLPRGAAIASFAGAALLVAIQAWGALAARPSYLTAYNPLAGGATAAGRVMLVGWGEGLEDAAAYLNDAPGSEDGRVAAWYGKNVFGAFYRGTSFDLYYDTPLAENLYEQDVDWVVTYVNQEQRDLVDPSVRSLLGAPLHTVAHDGVALARVYAWPKPFEHTGDRQIGEGLRLLGWQIGAHDRRAGALPVTLFWDEDALAAVPEARVVIWIKDAAGEVWAFEERLAVGDQQGGAPLAGDWPGVPVTPQSIVLRPPVGLSPGPYRIEVAPFGGSPNELTVVELQATRADEVAAFGPKTIVPAAEVPEAEVRFADAVRLVGATLDATGDTWTAELVWEWLATAAAQHHYFVHVVAPAGDIVAQQDGVLPPPGSPGDLARQRIRLEVPEGATASARVYVGVYRPEDGVRLPLTVGSAPIPDGRHLLVTLP